MADNELYLFFGLIILINTVCYIKVHKTDKSLVKKSILRQVVYICLVFLIYKIIGDKLFTPLLPAFVLLPFAYFDIKNNK